MARSRYLQTPQPNYSQSSESPEPLRMCPCGTTNQKHSALSYHLKLLKEGGMVGSRREQSFQIYDLIEFESLLLKHIKITLENLK